MSVLPRLDIYSPVKIAEVFFCRNKLILNCVRKWGRPRNNQNTFLKNTAEFILPDFKIYYNGYLHSSMILP